MADEVGATANIGDFAEFHINPEEINAIIEIHGVGAEFRRGVMCPCQRPESGMARSECSVCKGVGWTYPKARYEPAVVLLTSRRGNLRFDAGGTVVDGQASCTFPMGYTPRRGDVIMPECEIHLVDQILYRQQKQLTGSELRENATVFDQLPPAVVKQRDRLLYDDAVIVWVHYIQGYGTKDEKLVEAHQGVHYRLAPGGEIVWLDDAMAPLPGQSFTVSYEAPAAYIVLRGEPVLRMEGGQRIPWRTDVERLDKWALEDFR